jgi:hypothetical protein
MHESTACCGGLLISAYLSNYWSFHLLVHHVCYGSRLRRPPEIPRVGTRYDSKEVEAIFILKSVRLTQRPWSVDGIDPVQPLTLCVAALSRVLNQKYR